MELKREGLTDIHHHGFLEEERRLYTADSLNDLHKMNICSSLKDLKDLTAPHQTSQIAVSPAERATGATSEDKPTPGNRVEESGETFPPPSRPSSPPSPLLLLVLLLAMTLLTSLALSAYAVYLLVEMTSGLAELTGGPEERSFLEELQQWKNLLQQYLDHRQGQSS